MNYEQDANMYIFSYLLGQIFPLWQQLRNKLRPDIYDT